jgi:hypothetical protein
MAGGAGHGRRDGRLDGDGRRHLTGLGFGRFVGASRASGTERPSDGGYGDGEVSEPKRFPPDGAGCLL